MSKPPFGASHELLGRPKPPEEVRLLPAGCATWARADYFNPISGVLEARGDQDRISLNDGHRTYGAYGGVGSYLNSARAAELAKNKMDARLADFVQSKPIHTVDEVERALRQGYTAIRGSLDEMAKEKGSDEMGLTTALTTIVVKTPDGPCFAGLAAGDLQCVLLRGNSVFYLTSDHRQVRIVPKSDGKDNVLITNFLGRARNGYSPDGSLDKFFAVLLQPGDRFALGSDGAFGNANKKITNKHLRRVLTEPTPQEAAERLLRLSMAMNYDDKVVGVVFVAGEKQPEAHDVTLADVIRGADETLYGAPLLPPNSHFYHEVGRELLASYRINREPKVPSNVLRNNLS